MNAGILYKMNKIGSGIGGVPQDQTTTNYEHCNCKRPNTMNQASDLSQPLNFKRLSSTANDELFERYPDADWDYELLSSNNNISEEIVTKYADKPWNMLKLSVKTNTKHLFDKYDKKINDELTKTKTKKRRAHM